MTTDINELYNRHIRNHLAEHYQNSALLFSSLQLSAPIFLVKSVILLLEPVVEYSYKHPLEDFGVGILELIMLTLIVAKLLVTSPV